MRIENNKDVEKNQENNIENNKDSDQPKLSIEDIQRKLDQIDDRKNSHDYNRPLPSEKKANEKDQENNIENNKDSDQSKLSEEDIQRKLDQIDDKEIIPKASKSISEVSKKYIDIPKFGESVNLKDIKDFNEADKKLSIEKNSIDKEISNNIPEKENLTNKDIKECKEEIKNLSENEQNHIREETGWSDEIINHIESWEQYEVYRDADLHELKVNGRVCLVKDIDLDYIDEKTGLTNKERMEKGLSAIDSKTEEKIELHHMGQSFDSPFAELNANSEHGGKNHSILHDNSVESWRRDPELKNQYQNHDKPDHWKNRLNEGEE